MKYWRVAVFRKGYGPTSDLRQHECTYIVPCITETRLKELIAQAYNEHEYEVKLLQLI